MKRIVYGGANIVQWLSLNSSKTISTGLKYSLSCHLFASPNTEELHHVGSQDGTETLIAERITPSTDYENIDSGENYAFHRLQKH